MRVGPAVRSSGRAHSLYGGLFTVSRGRLWTVSSNSYFLESRRRSIWTHSAYFWQSESMKTLCQAGNGPILGPRRLPSGSFVPRATAKLYVSELTAHHSPSTFLSKPNQPTYVMAISGRSQGASRAGPALSERLCEATGVKIKPGPPAKRHKDRRDGSSYTTLSS